MFCIISSGSGNTIVDPWLPLISDSVWSVRSWIVTGFGLITSAA